MHFVAIWHSPSHLPALPAWQSGWERTRGHRLHHRGDSTHLGGENTVCYLWKMHPTGSVTSWARPAPFGICKDPPPFTLGCCQEGARYKNVPLAGYWALSVLLVSVVGALKSGSHFTDFSRRLQERPSNPGLHWAHYRFPWEAKGMKLNNFKLVHLVKFQSKRANGRSCTWVCV